MKKYFSTGFKIFESSYIKITFPAFEQLYFVKIKILTVVQILNIKLYFDKFRCYQRDVIYEFTIRSSGFREDKYQKSYKVIKKRRNH